jgi:hypothetical protein
MKLCYRKTSRDGDRKLLQSLKDRNRSEIGVEHVVGVPKRVKLYGLVLQAMDAHS